MFSISLSTVPTVTFAGSCASSDETLTPISAVRGFARRGLFSVEARTNDQRSRRLQSMTSNQGNDRRLQFWYALFSVFRPVCFLTSSIAVVHHPASGASFAMFRGFSHERCVAVATEFRFLRYKGSNVGREVPWVIASDDTASI